MDLRMLGMATDSDAATARQLLEAAWQARELARAPVSGFRVGAAALDAQGDVHLGYNVEFAGAPLGETLHAEHAAVAVARRYAAAQKRGDLKIDVIAVTATPCGHCRQMLAERFPHIQIVLGDRGGAAEPTVLSLKEDLLPRAVTFDLLANPSKLALCAKDLEASVSAPKNLGATVLTEALSSFVSADARFSGWPRACVFVSDAGQSLATGSCMESVAFNPSQGCFQTALMALASEAQHLSRHGLPITLDAPSALQALASSMEKVRKVVLVQYQGALVDDQVIVEHLSSKVFSATTSTLWVAKPETGNE
ncbi:Cytidine deaminase 6 [Hondaea fermentalgiana]|uniref:Cytidine deaminase 6 n=1 Tax=Hondaea fermentalgiana TaxID=2315210 RepID=A0A2R5G1G8_9STRA|nr:Cytidine deaminase 6 [Hondaea fermentalgiana]|eukprot:GBG24867.1 Cytidine deaminase 6 [Hondaea fermentalgiana]